ncbi:23S rRNA (pseudouridine(1915)-N(3))-methyltransferase RlmH [Campylobacter sp. MIT 99-7217]|uniref:23S rRNA (pseudouridine(1915)-N(3))-methyltransferase RlmH n=1 Tax=Campylobacter sp. MIT 99-7217 TaxID=535091 RepID=UPI001158D477|nr:23S rRNA (pseudouridine(1915)-N(3))-methyltransferase RlmH [Campylobacter sp. MIT 99-7217]TQR31279.1 23S rRNA (pseudouridine(1915)-N(3))-methyltransferase RlmH [Campylobacter sp. MIT 99-7217]
MQINVFSIQKNSLEFKESEEKYIKFISKFALLKDISLFNNKIANAQKIGAKEAKKSYEEQLKPYKKGFCVVLDERGKELNSLEFSNLLSDKNELSFFIGGAFGLEEEFIKSFDLALSLSRLTLAHQFVKILLLEQIYRGFCIKYKHPYHK